MLKRKTETEIHNWINNDSRALLIDGVRQAGKTFIIRKCLQEADCEYVEFNLIEEPEVAELIQSSSDTDDLILKLSLYSHRELNPGKTFIFFDEIQIFSDMVTRIKFLVEDRRFRYILSGSLLGVEITGLRSAPVGYLTSIKMYPLDFEEFLQVFNVPEKVISDINTAYQNRTPLDDVTHKKMMDLFNLYIIIGGMPAAIEKYRSSENIDEVIKVHRDLLNLYKLDFTKYEEESKRLILSDIYEKIPAELNEQNKRFQFADINKNLRYERMIDSFTWLWKAGVALPVYNVTQPVAPLMINEKRNLFKLFLSDIGMLTSVYGKATKLKILQNDKDITKGAVYENVVAQELTAHGYDLYYYNSKKYGELDFVIEDGEQILPIEVKSGKSYKYHSALTGLTGSSLYNINKAIVFTSDNLSVNGNITYMPLYMIMALKKDTVDFIDISPEKYNWN